MREEVGNVTVLINNAGIMITKQFMKFTDQEIENTVNVREPQKKVLLLMVGPLRGGGGGKGPGH